MREKIKKLYYCDFCSKRYMQKPLMEWHEKHCTNRPENFAKCLKDQCGNLIVIKDGNRTTDFRCSHFNTYLYTSALEAKTKYNSKAQSYIERGMKMPTTCDNYFLGVETHKDVND